MGNAVAEVLFGDVNPSGKLPQTFPRTLSELPTRTPMQYPGQNGRADYSEGLFVGYRWFDEQGIEPLFPFGHGLSYTTFSYSRLAASRRAGGSVAVTFTVENSGSRSGAEVAQVYVGFPESASEPPKQLKGFQKLLLGKGQATSISLTLDLRAFAYWDSSQHAWVVAAGTYEILVGSSSRDIRLRAQVALPAGRLGA